MTACANKDFIDVKFGIIVYIEASRAIRQAVAAAALVRMC